MTGIFAPTLGESNTLIQPQSPIRPVDFGQAFQFADRVLDSFGGGDQTQKEKDNAALQPFARDQAKLFEGRDQLGVRYRNQVKKRYNKFIEENPILASEAAKLVEQVHGIKVEAEFDPGIIARRNALEYAQTPEGSFVFARSLRYTNGQLDYDATFEAFQANMFAEQGRKFGLQLKLDDAAASNADKTVRTNAEDVILGEKLGEDLVKSHELVKTFIQTATEAGIDLNSPEGINLGLQQLNEQILTYRTTLLEGVPENVRGRYDVEAAIQPLNDLKTILEDNREMITKHELATNADARLALGRLVEARTGFRVLGKDPEFFAWLDTAVLQSAFKDGSAVDIIDAFTKANKEVIAVDEENVYSGDIDLFDPSSVEQVPGEETGETNLPDDASTLISPELSEAVREMSVEERVDTINGLAAALTNVDEMLVQQDEGYRNMVAGNYVKLMATTFLGEDGGAVPAPESVDKIFSRFDKAYQLVKKADPVAGKRMATMAATVLAKTINTRATDVEEFSRSKAVAEMGTALEWAYLEDSNSITMVIDPRNPILSERAKNFISNLQDSGRVTMRRSGDPLASKLTLHDMLSFARPTGDATTLETVDRRITQELSRIQQKVDAMNKILRITDMKVPDVGKSPGWRNSLKSRFSTHSTNRPIPHVVVTSEADLKKLSPGRYVVTFGEESDSAVKIVVTTDGKVITNGSE